MGSLMTEKTMLNTNDDITPLAFHLSQNYPNPFSEKTTIKYCVAYKTRVQLTVYDYDGKVIEKLVDEEKNPGAYEAIFKLAISSQQLASKEYFYCLEAGDYKSEKKMLLLK
jgi:hypothetical protein